MTPNTDPNVAFKNILVAAVLMGIVAFAALAFRPGSVATVGQGGGSSWSGNGELDDNDDD